MKQMLKMIFIILPLLFTSACDYKKALTQEEKAQVISLKDDLKLLNDEIEIVSNEIEKYSGGLIKTTKEVRRETLLLSQAIVKQHIQSIESGAKLTITAPITQPSDELASKLKTEIEYSKSQLQLAKEKASSYNGGLLSALSLTTVATQEQTLALLEQKYLIAKYGLSFKLPKNESENTSAPETTSSTTSDLQALPIKNNKVIDNKPMLAADGPFGLAMGMKKEMFNGRLIQAESGVYFLKEPPVPHPQLETYAVKISDKSGLCWIKGIGKSIDTNSYGLQIKNAFNEFESKLNQRYGISERTDFLMPGSIWKKPEDWMMGLKKSDRYLMSTWKGEREPLENNLSSVALIAQVESTSSGYLAFEYSFTNKLDCDTEISLKDDAGL